MRIKATVKQKKTVKIPLSDEYIRLDDLLKTAGAVNTGGHAKIVIQDGEVKLNGEICTQRGKKLRAGDVAEFESVIYEVTANEGKLS
ncbi:MAG: RNA-binding S4 domain-containing protein [Clostridiales bacterium]|nr:RNA-binding S4 domain-containing protein [Clostridiales bacterium]